MPLRAIVFPVSRAVLPIVKRIPVPKLSETVESVIEVCREPHIAIPAEFPVMMQLEIVWLAPAAVTAAALEDMLLGTFPVIEVLVIARSPFCMATPLPLPLKVRLPDNLLLEIVRGPFKEPTPPPEMI
jgi:hypothetical protein